MQVSTMQTLSSWSHVHIISRHIICTIISYHNIHTIYIHVYVLCLHYTSSEIAPAQVPGTNLLPSHARAKAMGGGQLSGHLCYMIYIHLIQRFQSFGTSTSEFNFGSWVHPLDFSILQNFKLSQSDHQAKEVPHSRKFTNIQDMIRLIPQNCPAPNSTSAHLHFHFQFP